MSEILGRTWSYLTSSGSGPKWTCPSNQTSNCAHLPHGLAVFMKQVIEAPTKTNEAEIVNHQLNAIRVKLQEPNLKTSVLSDCIVRSMLCSMLGYNADFASIYCLTLAQKGEQIKNWKASYNLLFKGFCLKVMSLAIFRFDSRKEDRLLGLPNVCQSI